MSESPPTPVSLIARVCQQKASEEDWRRLTEVYQGWVMRQLLRYQQSADQSRVEDQCQRVFIKLWRALPGSAAEFEAGKFHRWLYRVARNEAVSWYREQKTRTATLPDSLAGPESAGEVIDREHCEYLARTAWDGMKSADPERWQWQAFEALVFVDEPVEFVARRFGCTVANLYQIRSRTMRELRRRIVDIAGPDCLESLGQKHPD